MKTIEIFAEAVKFASEASDIPSDRILSESRDADVVDARMLVIQTLYDTLVHELHHLVAHICEGSNVDLSSEEACYLAGGLAQLIHNDAAPLLCDCCRKKKGKHCKLPIN